ncbi:hypothetical protein WR25_02803 [Diploscapter pachys]|uniref:Uncharacterized protein n=1 Tax=Diploscapter pachys TaxID=2018661 RepID=A0A2A2LY49_9BILA|nr:hypothetical protein WR25_02803 [Diploscapter pachys]
MNSMCQKYTQPSIIKADVAAIRLPNDKLLLSFQEISDTFIEKLYDNEQLVANSTLNHTGYQVLEFIRDFQKSAKSASKRAIQVLRYNNSREKLDGFKYLCKYELYPPRDLTSNIGWTLINPCSLELTKEERNRFANCMENLKNYDISLYAKSSIAYYSSKYPDKQCEELVQDYFRKFPILDGIKFDYFMEKMSETIHEHYGSAKLCLLDDVFYRSACNKEVLTDFNAYVKYFLQHNMVSSTVCAAVVENEPEDRKKYLEEVVRNMNHVVDHLNKYLSNAVKQSVEVCEPWIINQTIKEFDSADVKKKVEIHEDRFQILGDQIISDLNSRGDTRLRRHIVVTRNLPHLTKYLHSCPGNNCRIIENPRRDIKVFYISHEPFSRMKIQLHDFYFNNSMDTINQTIWELSATDNLETIRQALDQKNVSLASEDGFRTELWQLNISLIGQCSLRMTKQHIIKYSECMRLLSQIDIPLKIKSGIAYISAMQTQQFHYEVTQKILANDDLLKDYSMEKALFAMDSNQGYELSCMPDSIYFSNSCNRKNLVGFLNNIKILLLHIASGATICSSIISENDAVRREYLEKIINSINRIVKFQNDYLDNAMGLSFTACEAFVINQTIHDFDSHVDKGASIRRNRFKTLGDTIINDLASRGSSKMGRHVVITRNLPLLSKYLPSCPSGNCRVIQNTQRDITVFYTAHDPLKQSMKKLNDDFFDRSMASINNTIW